MAMTVIIDGYNLLGASQPVQGRAPQFGLPDREGLLRSLAGYRRRKGHPVLVVFDGWRTGGTLEQHDHCSGVEIVYSRRGERADQVIQRLAQEYGTSCAVVSSDHEVINSARSAGAVVVSAAEFLGRMRASASEGSRQSFKELDVERDEAPGRRTDKKGNPRRLPKSVRKRRRQLRGF